jgi:hypothetical protein
MPWSCQITDEDLFFICGGKDGTVQFYNIEYHLLNKIIDEKQKKQNTKKGKLLKIKNTSIFFFIICFLITCFLLINWRKKTAFFVPLKNRVIKKQDN